MNNRKNQKAGLQLDINDLFNKLDIYEEVLENRVRDAYSTIVSGISDENEAQAVEVNYFLDTALENMRHVAKSQDEFGVYHEGFLSILRRSMDAPVKPSESPADVSKLTKTLSLLSKTLEEKETKTIESAREEGSLWYKLFGHSQLESGEYERVLELRLKVENLQRKLAVGIDGNLVKKEIALVRCEMALDELRVTRSIRLQTEEQLYRNAQKDLFKLGVDAAMSVPGPTVYVTAGWFESGRRMGTSVAEKTGVAAPEFARKEKAPSSWNQFKSYAKNNPRKMLGRLLLGLVIVAAIGALCFFVPAVIPLAITYAPAVMTGIGLGLAMNGALKLGVKEYEQRTAVRQRLAKFEKLHDQVETCVVHKKPLRSSHAHVQVITPPLQPDSGSHRHAPSSPPVAVVTDSVLCVDVGPVVGIAARDDKVNNESSARSLQF